MSLKQELKEIYDELENIDKENFSWKKVEELYNKFEEKYSNAKSEEITEEIETARLIFWWNLSRNLWLYEAITKRRRNASFSGWRLRFYSKDSW